MPPPEAPVPLESLRGRIEGTRVLLAEDEPLSQEFATVALQDAGLAVDLAADGLIAVQKLRAAPEGYALIFMDMQMPHMDGLAATRVLRRMGVSTPIVAMTANAFEEDRKRCLEAGMNDFLAKPVDPERLHQLLDKWLAGPGR